MNKQRRVARLREEIQKRAENLKSYEEQRAELVEQMKTMTNGAEMEQRAFTEEEEEAFDGLEKKVQQIDDTVARIKRSKNEKMTNKEEDTEGNKEEMEERAFDAYIRGKIQERADANLTYGENGAIIPKTIANRIIKKVYDICPILEKAKRYGIGGTLTIPYYDETNGGIKMAFADEFKKLESSNGKYLNITLNGFLAGALSKISKSLINNSQFDVVSEVVDNMSMAIASFMENILLNGAEGKVEGLSKMKNVKTAASATAVTMDELIELRDSVKDAFQSKCIWVMNTKTRTAIRKLKDANGRYLMQDDVTSPFGITLLGKPVYVSDNAPEMEAGKKAIIYGDMSGLAVKLTEEASIQVLLEKYADEHAVGVIVWLEIDSKVENEQMLAALQMKAA